MEWALVLGGLDAALCLAAALVVLFSAPGRRENRILATLLFFEAGLSLGAGIGLMRSGADPSTVAGFAGVFAVSVAVLGPLYLLLLRDLPTPLARPLRPRASLAVIVLAGIALAVANLRSPPFPVEHDLTRSTYRVLMVANLLGLLLAADSWRRAPRGTPQRRRARLFAVAFGLRDAFFVAFMVSSLLSPIGMGARWLGLPITFYGTLLFVPLLAYAILRGQILGIELTLKRGLRRGVVIAAFVLVFFLASEATERFVTVRYGPLGGLAAAGALALGLAPLQRAADRLVDRAMPGVESTSSYLEARRLEVYRAALESAHESGGISEKERETLARLREKLGVPAEAGATLEREVVGGAPR